MKKILKERINGLFLIILAGLVAIFVAANSQKAESKNEQNLTSNDNQTLDEGQILGQTEDNGNLEEVDNDSEDLNQNQSDDKDNQQEKSEKQEEKKVGEKEEIRCNELESLLKKYCGKNYNVKKCRNYLLETKDLVEKDEQCKKAYKKYHFVPKKEEKNDNSNSTPTSDVAKKEVALTIDYSGTKSDEKYTISMNDGATVMDIMRNAKNSGLSYDESSAWPGYIQEINGVREDISKSTFWMLFYNGEMAMEGASTLKVKTGDKIEWRYMEVNF